jgi:hypothetical protein
VSNQATLGRLDIAQGSFPLALRFELHARFVTIGELDTGGLKGGKSRASIRGSHWLVCLKSLDRTDGNSGCARKVWLRPSEEPARSDDLATLNRFSFHDTFRLT